jgi:G:T/U-mismatch repair DNA glycosylase
VGRNLAGAAWEAGYPRVDAAAGVIKTLAGAGFTGRQLDPSEERLLLDVGCGITNLVARTTAAAAELSDDELADGWRALVPIVARLR